MIVLHEQVRDAKYCPSAQVVDTQSGRAPSQFVVPVGQTPPPAWHTPPWQFPLAHWLLRLHFLPLGLGGGAAEAMPGTEASVPPRRAAPINLSALPRETVPLAIPLARASKELSLVSSVIGYVPSQKRAGRVVSPTELINVA